MSNKPERVVTEAMVEAGAELRRADELARKSSKIDRTHVIGRAADKHLPVILAALSAEPAAQGEVLIEAVGRVERDMTGELGINWLVEGGIDALIEGSVLLCSDHDHLTDDDGSATLYTDPPAQTAERVPEGWKLVPIDATPAMQAAGGHANSEWLNDNAPIGESRYGGPVMRSVWEAMLAATPAAPAEEGDGKEVNDTLARELYIASQCDAHNLHTLAWHELTETQRDEWRKKATGAAR